jgi:oligopeptide transport system substrate-binding protein
LPQAQREAQARALYRAAGYSRRHPLVIELRYNTSTPHRRMALAVAAMWRQVLGVQVRLRNEEWKVFVGNRKQRVITQVFRGGWIADVPDARNVLAAFGSDGPLNWTGYDDAGFRERLAKADAARSETARNAWLHAAEQRVLNDDAVLPLYFYTSKHLVDARVSGYEANALDRHASRWLHLRP